MHNSDIKGVLSFIEKNIEYPDFTQITGASTNPEIIVKDQKKLIFCSNNYLGIATDPRTKEVMHQAVDTYGMGSGGSRLVSGSTDVQALLEAKIALFKGQPAAITFSTGYMANTGIIPALMQPPGSSTLNYLKNLTILRDKAAIISDELNHASIVDGIRLSKAEKFIYPHRDMEKLEQLLDKVKKYKYKMVVTDGVFSMDGDIAPLPEIINLARAYDATVMVDDAHATGIIGKTGRGTSEHFELKDEPDVTMGTFTKVFGGVGGYVVGSEELIRYLRVTARSYIFSAPIPPVIAAGLVKSIDIVQNEPSLRLRLWENVTYLKNLLLEYGFNTLGSETQIMPIFIGDEKKAIAVSRRLLELGFYIACVRWPAVSKGQSRLRLTLMAHHTKKQIDSLIHALVRVKNEYSF